MTNLVKCASEYDGNDTTSPLSFEKCVLDSKVIMTEIKILQPDYLVFYTSSFYIDKLDFSLFDEFNVIKKPTKRNKVKNCDKKEIGWRSLRLDFEWDPINVLVTSHPEGKKKK